MNVHHILVASICFSIVVLTSTSCSFVASPRGNEPAKVGPRANIENVEISSEPIQFDQREFDEFEKTVKGLIKKRDFAALETMAVNLRTNKTRFEKGGGWKIHSFYRHTIPDVEETEQAWIKHIKLLEQWTAAMPNSIAARTVLAMTLLQHAWKARGSGYASEVSGDQMILFEKRMERAEEEMIEASRLEERCYGYFEALLRFAMTAGLPREDFEKAFAEANAYDSSYQYFYIAKAIYLMPRWHGGPGELRDFAEGLLQSQGEHEGLKLYYLIADELQIFKFDLPGDFIKENGISWKRVKQGFVLYEKDHGLSRRQMNQFAGMAISVLDPQAACNSFKRLQGEDSYDPRVWKTRTIFENERNFARNGMCPETRPNSALQ